MDAETAVSTLELPHPQAAPGSPGLAVWQPPSHLGVLRATGCREQHFPGTRHQRHQGESVGLSERLQRPAPAQNTPSPERAVPLDGSGVMRAVPTEGGQPGLPPPGRRQGLAQTEHSYGSAAIIWEKPTFTRLLLVITNNCYYFRGTSLSCLLTQLGAGTQNPRSRVTRSTD